ncbi:CbtA family protein [Bauldia litoralis]|uniref:Cobalt transporter subunit CbtA n=1 Tax=Bauldia litoralis TaxID=665467 RepID=A0A1G6DAU8_9HYPH|nr:CbtA family protein [Bauldia litoralis]SDB41975.1 cobalt transporter subunit CbtA [Bauldia litoralis]
MFRTIVFSAFGAGLVVCVVISALQFFTTEPLILHAEQFEGTADSGHHHDAATPAHDHGDAGDWAPADGFERRAYTVLANLVLGAAVSLILLAAMVLRGDRIDARHGLLWGAAGFVAASLMPALGLPPELPGTPAADLVDRQVWWLATVVASAAGIALIAFGRHWAVKAAGLALFVLPHVIGAPPPPGHEVAYPGALAGEFVIASLVVSAVLWTLAGFSAGWLHRRLSGSTQP